jgi:hypothetical protein
LRTIPDPTSVPVSEIAAILAQLAAISQQFALRLLTADFTSPPPVASAPEWNLTVEEMMRVTGKSRRWLFAHKNLPFIRRISRKTIRGDETLLRRWLSSRRA